MTADPRVIDVAVIGGGGAGLTAATYAARGRRSAVVFERLVVGGQIATTDAVENFPGFPNGVNGLDLSELFREQAERFGAEMAYTEVTSLQRQRDGRFLVTTAGEGEFLAWSVIVTAGADYNKLGIPGESELVGKGVSYCATCDAAFFADQDVAVVGGGDAAFDESLFASRYARSVTLIHRRDEYRASALLQERAFANPKFRFITDTVVDRIEANGSGLVNRIELRDVNTGTVSQLPVTGVFIFIGQTPNSHLLKGLVEMDAGGHAIVDLRMHTSVPGLFVAGDLRAQAARQLVSACGDGATAAISAEEYLSSVGVGER